ncbi:MULTISPECIES: DUF4232 domain-containing protein [unclassified Curtobacterium]|uniref:DUF4232 domain-containing protein n=1 Tax=unclassified Curtobacterium TaxID=257496 RepID=UPI00226BA691|nr:MULTISPECIES: DUF4232 domain-containing protein [unclassified Curtobacterium]
MHVTTGDRTVESSEDDGSTSEQRAGRAAWLVVPAVAAGLWLLSGALAVAVTWNGVLPNSVNAVLPLTLPFSPVVHPWSWSLTTTVLAALVVALVVRLVVPLTDRASDRSVRVALAWFAVVLGGAAAGLAVDLATIVGVLPAPRLRMLLDGLGANATVGAWWGVVQGWLPALVVLRRSAVPVPLSALRDTDDPGPRTPARTRRGVLVAVAVVAAAAVVTTGALGQRAARVSSAQEAARAEGADPEQGALPDPYAAGTPVPTRAPAGDADRDPSWCTEDQAMLLLGDPGAATGHRSQTIRFVNHSDAPCVVEGYPDVAFADQNGNELAVTVEHGGSFLAEDPGSTQFELPAGASAVTTLGWDAGATSDALVARTMYAAPFPTDERGSWPVEYDVVTGSVVHVTAWALEATAPTTAP